MRRMGLGNIIMGTETKAMATKNLEKHVSKKKAFPRKN
jgi:hypothetical protein